jgi:ParB family chromosome partitioning protein
MEKEYRKISSLKGWDKNPRSIKDKDFQRLKRMIEKLGEFKPLIILEDGTVLGGNMRLRVYKELGWGEAWVSVVEADTEKEKLAYALADNERAGFYDEDLLANLTGEFPDFEWGDYAVDLKPPVTLKDLFPEETVEDEVPAVSDEPAISKLGEVYQLGKHRLMCGDATKIEDVEKLMDGQKADMVFTDPPYSLFGNSTGVAGVTDDKMTRPFFLEIFRAVKRNLKQFGHAYTCCDWRSAFSLQNMAAEAGLTAKNMCIWDKGDGGLSNCYWQTYEIVWFHANSPKKDGMNKKRISGERLISGLSNIWRIKKVGQEREHFAQKPVELSAFAIKNSTDDKELVLDLFGGSGSTLIACEQTNRICYMMELDPKYCDVIRKRYAKFINREDWQDATPKI